MAAMTRFDKIVLGLTAAFLVVTGAILSPDSWGRRSTR